MKTLFSKNKRGFALLIFLLILLSPIRSYAHNAYFLQVLIDDHRYQYVGSVVEDNASYFESENKHLEAEMGYFGGLKMDVQPNKETKEGYEKYEKALEGYNLYNSALSHIMTFTFSPKEIPTWYGSAKNHATKVDVERGYKAQENLMPGLNDALKLVNGGVEFKSTKELLETGHELAKAINGSGSISGYTITKGKTLKGKAQKGFDKEDYITIKKGDEVYEFIYRSKKGYSGNDKYKGDTEYITWNQLMYQGNYAMIAKGYTLKNGAELTKPGPVEEAIVSLLGNTFNQLRNILGLYEINDLVFNEGVRGSSAWTHGVMSSQWADKAIAYHWVFQALAWSLITFAIVKLLIQRNLATINSTMRISLMEGIQNLLITGVLLANAIPVINMFMFLNAKLVAVFGATAPDFASLGELNAYSNMLGGILIQFFYLGVSIYLNFVYIMRAITIALLLASAPLFIVTIAFGGQWKQLFSTWMRELIGNIFLQSFHAFMLSFFFAISTSSRGIEGMIVMMALIPMTEFFRSLVMGQGGGIAHSMGMSSMAQAGSLVGGALSTATGGGKTKQNGKSSDGGSGRETSSSSSGDSGMGNLAGNSDKIKNNSETMNQRQRMNATKESMGKRETPLHISGNANHKDSGMYKNDYASTKPEGFGQTVRDKIEGVQESMSNAKQEFNSGNGGKIAKATGGALKAGVGATQVAVGLGTAMALGAENPYFAQSGVRTAQSGQHNVKSGASQVGSGAMSMLPESTKAYETSTPNGDRQIHRNASTMAEQGVVGASMEGSQKEPIAKYTYDTSKMQKTEREDLADAYGAYARNDEPAMEHYKSQGIQNVTKNGNGNLVVRYNQTGMDKMGIKSVQTIGGSGENSRIVETKASNSPNTLRTIPVDRYKPIGLQQEGTGNNNTV